MPTLASSSRARLAYIVESVYGTTPGAGNGRYLRFTGESLNYDLSKEESKEIRDDRQVNGATTVDAQAAGGVNFHFSYGEYDWLLEAAMQGTWVEYGTAGVGATFTATFTTTAITASVATSGTSLFTILKKGQWFRLVAPSDPNDGLFFRVSTETAPTSTVITVDASTPLIAAVGVANCLVQGSRLTNATTLRTFSLEKSFADVTQFLLYKGMGVSKCTLNFGAAGLTDGSLDFMGKNATRAGTTGMPGSTTASQTGEIMNASRGVNHLWEGTTPLTSTYIKSLSLSLDNNLRGQKAIGNLGNVGLGVGDFKVSGQMEAYFADGAQFDKFLNDTYTQLVLGTKDADGVGYVATLPRVLLMNAKITAGAKNQDIMASFDIMAFSDDENAESTLRKTMFLDRCGASPT